MVTGNANDPEPAAPLVDDAGNTFIAGETQVDGVAVSTIFKLDAQNHCTTYTVANTSSTNVEHLWQVRDGSLLFGNPVALAKVTLPE